MAYFNVFEIGTVYEGGRRLWVLWWRKKTAENRLKVTVEAISLGARVWWRQKSDRRGGIEGVSEGWIMDSKGYGQGR